MRERWRQRERSGARVEIDHWGKRESKKKGEMKRESSESEEREREREREMKRKGEKGMSD